jgi:glycine cleavage system P protein (glycine dehydrogenase)
MMRLLSRWERKDYGLNEGMIPLGSCTMKLNAASAMIPITWPGLANVHPFVPPDQAKGYRKLISRLEKTIAEVTSFDAVSLQPNAGAQGEYAGLMCIRAFHEQNGDGHRNVCLIPTSAHGTNPASAAMAGYKIIDVKCRKDGYIDLDDLHAKIEAHKYVTPQSSLWSPFLS